MVVTLFKIYAWRDFDPVYPKSTAIAHKEKKKKYIYNSKKFKQCHWFRVTEFKINLHVIWKLADSGRISFESSIKLNSCQYPVDLS